MSMLRQGSRGEEVATLQAALNFYVPTSPPLAVDSIFGPKTEARVRIFQQLKGLAVDGIAGPKTEAVLYSCLAINAWAFAVRRPRLRLDHPSLLPGAPRLLPPGGMTLPVPVSRVQQASSPFRLPPLKPPFLTPGLARPLTPGIQLTWAAEPSNWEFWSAELLVLSRKLELKAELVPEKRKMGSLPGYDLNVVGSAKWILIPERLRRPSFFLDAAAQTGVPPSSITGRGGLNIEFRGHSLAFTVEGNSAFDIDPQGMAGTDKTVLEGNLKLFYQLRF